MSKEDDSSYWEEFKEGSEWINFYDDVSVEITIEEAEPEEVETPWGVALVLRVWEFAPDQLTGGIRKNLRINSKRLRRGIKNATPNGIPSHGATYRIRRSGEGWATTYNVEWIGKYKILPGGKRTKTQS